MAVNERCLLRTAVATAYAFTAAGAFAQAPTSDVGDQTPEGEAASEGADDPDPTRGHILDATGYLLRRGTVELGLFYLGYGITDWFNVGIHPLPYIAAPLLKGGAGNVSAKFGVPFTEWLDVGLEGNLTWVRIDNDGGRTRGFIYPITLAASAQATPEQNYSLAMRYVGVNGGNETDRQSQELEGAAITRLFQVIVDGRYRITETTAIYARGYVEPWDQNLNVDSEIQLDQQTTVQIEGEAAAAEERIPWSALAGAHFRWGSINLRVGVGYGNYFIPRLSLPVFRSVFPDLDFYARF